MAIGESEAWLQGKWGMAIGETDAWLYGNWDVAIGENRAQRWGKPRRSYRGTDTWLIGETEARL